MTEEETRKAKAEIDALSQFEMCRLWRFAPPGHPFFQGEIGEYFHKKLKEKGGMTPEISKDLGWKRGEGKS